jgi:hypothetical protein
MAKSGSDFAWPPTSSLRGTSYRARLYADGCRFTSIQHASLSASLTLSKQFTHKVQVQSPAYFLIFARVHDALPRRCASLSHTPPPLLGASLNLQFQSHHFMPQIISNKLHSTLSHLMIQSRCDPLPVGRTRSTIQKQHCAYFHITTSVARC